MREYRAREFFVNATEITRENIEQLAHQYKGKVEREDSARFEGVKIPTLVVFTIRGSMRLWPGDFLIINRDGSLDAEYQHIFKEKFVVHNEATKE